MALYLQARKKSGFSDLQTTPKNSFFFSRHMTINTEKSLVAIYPLHIGTTHE